MGAKITTVCPSAYFEVVKNLGADRVIDYQTQDFSQTDERYEFVFDAVGKSRFRSVGLC
jgi:NADPH:quinone reductase-like Zn-dependent oxidoreductase